MAKKKKETTINDIPVRPQYGKCPSCKAQEREWCKKSCTLLDPANMARE